MDLRRWAWLLFVPALVMGQDLGGPPDITLPPSQILGGRGITIPGGAAASPFGGHASLVTGLEAYYKLDETGGTRTDQTGTYNLTDNNTVLSTTGKIANAARFVKANSEYLSVDAGVGNEIVPALASSTYSISMWIYFDSGAFTSSSYYLNADNGTNNVYSIRIMPVTSPVLRIQVFDGVGLKQVQVGAGNGLVDTSWNHLVCWIDTDRIIRMRVNNDSTVSSTALAANPVAFRRLGLAARPYGSIYQDCDLDELGLWSKVLSADEITALYNSGNGLTY